MSNGHHGIPAACRNPALWRMAADILAQHTDEQYGLCECGRFAPCAVRIVARRAQIRAMRSYGRAVGRVRMNTTRIIPFPSERPRR